MSNYRKEKNIIIIDLDGVNGDYRLDINTGIFYGVKGNQIKTCPRKGEIRRLFPRWSDDATNLSNLICCMLDNTTNALQYTRYAEAMMAADRLDAIGMPCLDLRYDCLIYLAENIKHLNAWYKAHEGEPFSYWEFERWCEFEKVRQTIGAAANNLTPEMYSALNPSRHNYTTEELAVCAYYMTYGKVWEYHEGSMGKLINYIVKCRGMGKTPVKTNNFMKEYVETIKAYELYKTEFDNNRIKANYAKHANAWDFTFGDFTVVVPTCGKDIVDEGQNMHHCVGGYVDKVVNNSTYIVFVRHKDTPDKCYLTAQVGIDGCIGQYYLAHDRHISSDEDFAFKEAFAKHLAEVWGE